MTTDAERRQALDAWTVQLREQRARELAATLDRRNATIAQQAQRLQELEAQLAAVTAERDDYRSKFRMLEGYLVGLVTRYGLHLDWEIWRAQP